MQLWLVSCRTNTQLGHADHNKPMIGVNPQKYIRGPSGVNVISTITELGAPELL